MANEDRGVNLDSHTLAKIDPAYHHLLDERACREIHRMVQQHGDFGWEYDPGYYDASWDGEGPDDIPESLIIRPPE